MPTPDEDAEKDETGTWLPRHRTPTGDGRPKVRLPATATGPADPGFAPRAQQPKR
jgi:hypothetical protein